MLTRRVALPLAALTAFATLPVLAGVAPANASSAAVSPASRGGDNGDPEGPNAKDKEPVDNCPTKLWTIPVEIKGLACVLLLPRPQADSEGEDDDGDGLLG